MSDKQSRRHFTPQENWGYAGSRPFWELELALLTHRIPRGRVHDWVYEVDHLQNLVLVSCGVFDLPQVTRHGGGPAIGIGYGFGPQITVTNAGSVDQLAGVAKHEGVCLNIPKVLDLNVYEVHGQGYEGVQFLVWPHYLYPIPWGLGAGGGCSWDEVWTWMWR